ncbi:MAG: type II toxin-antitoxin system ParD family antitoxin [Cohaesibacter sp.]|nr:type II toxin-antitoxin system ParD family antitoxin [Cohaesibacter sp.]MCV6601158.1 type II toxin-antitoxin system ParD family antitoxin [Cohaesibacter sp.]
MSVKASVSISEQQDKFVRELVEDGRYSSVSAVVQQGIELLRHKTEADVVQTNALRVLLKERMEGPFVPAEEFNQRLESMLARKREEHGLDD